MVGAGDLRGKTVFVVGGSGGLGKEMSKVMASQEGTEAIGSSADGSAEDISALENRFPSAHKIAPENVAAVATNDFAILDRRLEPQILWANMIGTSPRRGWGIVDCFLAFLMVLVYPFVRRQIEKQCKGDALRSA